MAFRRSPTKGNPAASKISASLLLLLLLLLLASSCSPVPPVSGEAPVEPVVTGLENTFDDMLLRGRFSVVDPEMKIYALAVSHSGDDILFSSDARSIYMLDDQGHLKWEVVSIGLPVAAEMSANDLHIAVGTDCGQVYYLHKEGKVIWEKSFKGAVECLALSPDSSYMAVSIKDENGAHILYGLDRWGTLLWERETAPLLQLLFPAEGRCVFFLEKNEEEDNFVVVKNGEILWERQAFTFAVSGNGEFVVIYSGNELFLYSFKGTDETTPHLLWSHPLCSEINLLVLTEEAEQVLAYSTFPGTGNNLFLFSQEGYLSWEKKIPSGSLLQVSRFGDMIVASSWQEYSENFSKVLVLSKTGDTLQEIEMASRIEKISLSGDGNILALAGNEGNIFIMDMPAAGISKESEISEGDLAEHSKELYRPVVFNRPEDGQYITLYFYDEYAMRLVPVNRNIKSTSAVLQAAVSELVKGPCRLSGLSRTIPKDSHIKATLQDGIALIDLPEELNRLGGTQRIRGIIDSLILTASQFPSVEGVRFLVDGNEAEMFGAEGIIIDDIFPSRSPVNNRKMLYLPYRSGERYFLFPRETVQLGNIFNTVGDLLEVLLEESRCFLPILPQIVEIKKTKEEIILDWDLSFKHLFPPEGSSEEKALATLFLDSILLTLGSNYQQERFVLFVGGEPWEPPPGYPSTVLEFRKPFYINPE